ncbi:uncharacterized protein LOC62_05G006816 [Vanrija pseudolonga]|uniref:Uncharacterized protein n=1 Tax=Vanrija pseudolonga TaxID=143232 RepID=A0AAF0YAY2_9TREE|nr:hypothetical protein LOC62_05G006816 [Vanrija pseudolonga]
MSILESCIALAMLGAPWAIVVLLAVLGCLGFVSALAADGGVNFVGIPALADMAVNALSFPHIFDNIIAWVHAAGDFGTLQMLRQTGSVGKTAVDKLVKHSKAIAVDECTLELRTLGGAETFILRKDAYNPKHIPREARAIAISDAIDLGGEFTPWHLKVLGDLRIRAPTVRFLSSFRMNHSHHLLKALLETSQMGSDTCVVFSSAYRSFENPKDDPKDHSRSWHQGPMPAARHVVINLPFGGALFNEKATIHACAPTILHPSTELVTINIRVLRLKNRARPREHAPGAVYKVRDDTVRLVELETSLTRQIRILGLEKLDEVLVKVDRWKQKESGHQAGGPHVTDFLPTTHSRLTTAAMRHTTLFGEGRENANLTAEERLSRLYLQQLPFYEAVEAWQLGTAKEWKKEIGEKAFKFLTLE